MKPPPLLRGFLPLIVLWAMPARTANDTITWAAGLALVLAAGMLWFQTPRRPLRILSLVQLGLLATVAALGLLRNATVDHWLATWGRGTVTMIAGLTLVVLVPLVPFTLQYTRLTTPPAYWSAPTFTRINRVLSLTWGAAIAVIGLASILATAIDRAVVSITGAGVAEVLLNWLLPIAVTAAMLMFSRVYPDRVINPGPLENHPGDAKARHQGAIDHNLAVTKRGSGRRVRAATRRPVGLSGPPPDDR